jgi:hypothetical protein
LRLRLILALQRALISGAVAAGLALLAAFWVPPFSGAQPSASRELLDAELPRVEP